MSNGRLQGLLGVTGLSSLGIPALDPTWFNWLLGILFTVVVFFVRGWIKHREESEVETRAKLEELLTAGLRASGDVEAITAKLDTHIQAEESFQAQIVRSWERNDSEHRELFARLESLSVAAAPAAARSGRRRRKG